MSKAEIGSILFTGAKAGDIVEGMTTKNKGLVLQLRQDQMRGENGWLKGRFKILDNGNGTYAQQIEQIVGETCNAKELIEMVLDAIGPSTKRRLTILDRNSLAVRPDNREDAA